jgi:hypothetical protein
MKSREGERPNARRVLNVPGPWCYSYFGSGTSEPKAVSTLANCPHKLTKAAGPLARRRSRLGRLRTARTRHVGCSSLLPLRVGRGSRRAAPRGQACEAAFAA